MFDVDCGLFLEFGGVLLVCIVGVMGVVPFIFFVMCVV